MLSILHYEFMQNAVISAVLISIACGIIGSLVVINRMVFIVGGIAHGSYGGIGIAFFIGIAPLLGASVFAFCLAILTAFITFNNKNRADSVIGAIWAFGMAVGIIFIDLTPGYNVNLTSYLFGSILSVTKADIIFMSALDIIFLVLILLFYRQFCAVSFDDEFAKLRGVNNKAFYYLMILMMSFCVVATINLVGLILVIALITIPPYIAEKFSARLGTMMILSSILALIFCLAGLYISYKFNLTSGASIIIIATIGYFIMQICTTIKARFSGVKS